MSMILPLDTMLEALGNHAHRVLIEDKLPSLKPLYHLSVPGPQDIVISVFYRNSDEKDAVVAKVRALAHEHHAMALGFVGEVWMTSYKMPNLPPVIEPPSESPNRIEAVCATVTDGITTKTRSWQIVRDRPGGSIIALVLMPEEGATTLGGRMIDGILP